MSVVRRLDYIDALRGFAILGVIVAHTPGILPGFLTEIKNAGKEGVELFFLISALTLFHTLAGREQKEKGLVRNFYIRRFFRIAPLYYVVLFGLGHPYG